MVTCAQIIDPFGVVIAQCQPQTDDVCVGDIDLHALSAVRRFMNVGAHRRHDLWPQLWKLPPNAKTPTSSSSSSPATSPRAPAAGAAASTSSSAAASGSGSTTTSTTTSTSTTVPQPAAEGTSRSSSERRSSTSSGSGSESDPEARRLAENFPLPKPQTSVVPDDSELERLAADRSSHVQFGQVRIDPRCLFFQVHTENRNP